MNKTDLKTGMLVKFRNGILGVVMLNDEGDEDRIIFVNSYSLSDYNPLTEYTLSLTNTLSPEHDIGQVCTNRQTFVFNISDLRTAWDEEYEKNLQEIPEIEDVIKVNGRKYKLIKKGENNE